ncbi:MAG: hypothetical protein D6732_07855 [Methanobacteriota archaeon]|nr:MAG: hypothetical protein D6732_07855 [Euryarchaeota archaeon]
MIRAFVILSSKGFPIFEQYYADESIKADQKIIDDLAEHPNGFLSNIDTTFELIDLFGTEVQVRTIPLGSGKWLILISSDPKRDFLTFNLKDLKLAGIMVASGDSYAIEHVVSGFIHPLE